MKNDLKIITRNLIKNPVFGIVIISGFAFSLAISILLASYVFNESSYDKGFPDVDRIYRLCVNNGITSFRADKVDDIRKNYPEIERVCRYENGSADVVSGKSPFRIQNLVKTDKEFFKIFSLHIRSGDSDEPLPDNNSIAISASLAREIFGNSDPSGQVLIINHSKKFTITAVFDDLQQKSSILANAVIRWENVPDFGGEWRDGLWYSRLFIQLKDKSDPAQLAMKLSKDYAQDHYLKQNFRLLPLKNSYMSPLTMDNSSQTLHADLKSITLFGIVTILCLLISVLNFVILFTSSHLDRVKEIGIKRVTGAGRYQIFRQFITETVVISLFAFILGIYIALLFEKPFEALIHKELPVLLALHFPNILFVIPGVLILGVLSGFYPAVVISRYNPSSIFGDYSGREKVRMKNGLSVLQYLISITMVVAFIIMTRQNNLLTNKDIGFTKEQLINIDIPWEIKGKLPLIKQKLLGNPYIKSCTVSHGIPGRVSLWGAWSEAGDKYNYNGNIPFFTVDPDFFKVFDAEFIEGRGFREDDWEKSVVINESAFRLTGWKSIDGQVLKGIPTPEQAFGGASKEEIDKNSLKVVGVIRDINVEKLNQAVSPTIFECSDHFGISYLTCRVIPGDYPGVIADMKKTWNEVCPDFVFKYQFYDEWLDTLYNNEKQTALIIKTFTLLSIILTCLGTFGIIYFVSRRKTKEIGVRKVHGAKTINILNLLIWDIFKWIIIAYIIALPLSYFIMNSYLQGFAYKTTLNWWVFALAGLFALGIAIITIIWQSMSAARRNPVDSLRYE